MEDSIRAEAMRLRQEADILSWYDLRQKLDRIARGDNVATKRKQMDEVLLIALLKSDTASTTNLVWLYLTAIVEK